MNEELGQCAVVKRRKFWRRVRVGNPFPNFSLSPGQIPSICHCLFDGDNFFVTSRNDMHTLYHNGAFGVSTLTLREPTDYDDHYKDQIYYKKANERFELMQKRYEEDGFVGHVNTINVMDLSYPDSEDYSEDVVQVNCSGHSHPEEERLQLMSEEAMFLSFAVGCLIIKSSNGETLNYREVWTRLVLKNSEFPAQYAAYHYFRSKNWVPKNGASYGGSFVLYQVSPSINHSSYIVHLLGVPSRPSPNWTEVYALQRLASQVSKIALLCNITFPVDYDPMLTEPRSIFKMQLKEVSLFRWKPKQEQEEDNA